MSDTFGNTIQNEVGC